MRKTILFALVAILTLAVCSTAGAVPRQFFGIVQSSAVENSDYQKMGQAKVGTVRFVMSWPAIQPTSGSGYNWKNVDVQVGNLANQGIQAFPTIYGSPSWVASKPKQPPLKGKAAKEAWRNFLTAAVERYGSGGAYWHTTYQTQFPNGKVKPIKWWQIWNEPNLNKFFPKKNAAHQYAKLVKLSHEAIKKSDSHAKLVLAGMPSFKKPHANKFLANLYKVKKFKKAFEAAAVHPYAPKMDKFRTAVERMRKTMKKHHDGHAQLWLTEVGWGSKSNKQRLNKGKQGQKRMLKQSFKLLVHKRHSWHIAGVQWYDWRDPSKAQIDQQPKGCSFCSSAGLLKHSQKPKPAYRAFTHFTKH
jgi:polysaccharide biosynthesis protein PslG